MNSLEINSGHEVSRVLLKNERRAAPLSEIELTILAVLNAELNLNLDLEKQNKLDGVKLIGKELVRQSLTRRRLHDLGISLRSLGVIYLKLQGFSCQVNPLGSFGVDNLLFG